MLVISPWDPSVVVGAIDKAIRASDLGLNPTNDGKDGAGFRFFAYRRAAQGMVKIGGSTFTKVLENQPDPPCGIIRRRY